jgi:hypothetical protein
LTLGVFYGCQKENATKDYSTTGLSKSEEDKQLIVEAKAYFERRLDELRKQKEANKNKLNVRDNQTTDATFDGLDVNPKWDNAKVIRQNGSSFVESPFEFEGGKQFSLSISKNNNIAPDEKSASRLIVRKNRSGVQSANFMSVSADDEYLNGNNTSLKNFSYESVPNKFKGNEMHFNIDGSFTNGWHFADGKINGKIKKKVVGSLGVRDDCDVRMCVEISRYYVQVVSYRTTYVVMDCNNYSIRLSICGGWTSPGEWDNNSGGSTDNDNDWGGADPYPNVTATVEEYACSRNFSFMHLAQCSQKQEAGISGLYIDIKIEKKEANGHIETSTIHVDMGTLYFLSDYMDVDCEYAYSSSAAAKNAAEAINAGIGYATDIVKHNNVRDVQTIKSEWLKGIRGYFGGDVNYTKQISGLSGNLNTYQPCD